MRWASSPLNPTSNSFTYPHSFSLPFTSTVPSTLSTPNSFSSYAWDIFRSQESAHTQKIILYYKTIPCNSTDCSNSDICFYYHTAADRRRPPFLENSLTYSFQLCPNLVSCSIGEHCSFAHSQFEVDYHPAKYKTELCRARCRGDMCSYAHNDQELRNPAKLLAYQNTSLDVSSNNSNEFVDLGTFKTLPCKFKMVHDHKQCVYYHSNSDRRRIPVFYSAERCAPFQKWKHCIQGDNCLNCHNAVEQLYHPSKYKKRMCHELLVKKECGYGNYCCFAHSQLELKIELLHEMVKDENFYMWKFKTEWCPFKHEHNKSICVYAHNWQDYRRIPINYSPQSCPNWKYKKYVTIYEQGCINGFSCSFSHGWKEARFHPLVYKTMFCTEISKCHKGPDCPFYHSMADIHCLSENAPSDKKLPALKVTPLKEHKVSQDSPTAETLQKSEPPNSRSVDLELCDIERKDLNSKSVKVYPTTTKKYKRCSALKSLHMEAEEGEAEALDSRNLEKFLNDIGQSKYYEVFAKNKVTIYDLMIDAEEKCNLVGISNKDDINIIIEKVKAKIEDLDDEETPGMFE